MAAHAPGLILAAAMCILAVTAAPSDPLPSLKHDTDVGRLARPTRRMFLVDVIAPPPSTKDPLLTNEVDTSDDSDLPRIMRVLVPASEQEEDDYHPRTVEDTTGLDAASEELTKLRAPAAGQQASEWSDPAPEASAPSGSSPAEPSDELVPPAQDAASEWTQQSGGQAGELVAKEPSTRLEPPSRAREFFVDALKMMAHGLQQAVAEPVTDLVPPAAPAADDVDYWTKPAEGKAEARLDESESKETPVSVHVPEPATELVPPALPQEGAQDYWASAPAGPEARSDDGVDQKPSAAAAPVSEPATELLPPPQGQSDFAEWLKRPSSADSAPAKLEASAPETLAPEPATHLVPPAVDSYMPEKPSSGEARQDDFLSLGAAPPALDADTDYVKEHADSYLPEAGELKLLSEGPVEDDFLSIGEPPKEDEKKDDKEVAKEASKDDAAQGDAKDVKETETKASAEEDDSKDSYMPDSSSRETRDSYMPEETSKSDSEDSYVPDKDSREAAKKSSSEDADSIGLTPPDVPVAHDHSHEHVHEHEQPSAEEKDSDMEVGDDDVDGDGVKMSESKDFRKKRHICKACGGYGGGGGGIAVIIKPGVGGFGHGGGGGYCSVCGQPVYQQPTVVYKPVPVPVYKPVPVPVYQQAPVCNSCNQPPPPPPPCTTCGGGGYNPGYGGGSFSQSSSSSSSQSSSYSFG